MSGNFTLIYYLELPADLELPIESSSSWSKLSRGGGGIPGSQARGKGGPNVVGIRSVLCENFGELKRTKVSNI